MFVFWSYWVRVDCTLSSDRASFTSLRRSITIFPLVLTYFIITMVCSTLYLSLADTFTPTLCISAVHYAMDALTEAGLDHNINQLGLNR